MMGMNKLPMRSVALTVSLAIAVSACGGSTSAEQSATTTTTTAEIQAANEVVIARSRFGPLRVEVEAGTTVTFLNTDRFDHTVTSTESSPLEFDSGDLGQDEVFDVRFDEAGTYSYFCEIHPTMQATVVVK